MRHKLASLSLSISFGEIDIEALLSMNPKSAFWLFPEVEIYIQWSLTDQVFFSKTSSAATSHIEAGAIRFHRCRHLSQVSPPTDIRSLCARGRINGLVMRADVFC